MFIKSSYRGCCLVFASIFFILLTADIYAQGADSTTTELNTELVSEGALIFKNNCMVCHEIHEQR